MHAIYKKEIRSFFTSPLAYVVLAVLYFFSGLFFSDVYAAGSTSINYVFSNIFIFVLFISPILTMRLFSEEKRQKTDQALLTAPVKLSGIVLGKFFAALTVFTAGILITLVFQLIIAAYVTPDWMVFFSNFLGTVLLGAALIAIGIFISSLTESQVVAAVCSYALSLLLILMNSFSSSTEIPVLGTVLGWLSLNSRYNSFMQGIFDYSNAIFFLSAAAIFLFLTVRVLDKRRWS